MGLYSRFHIIIGHVISAGERRRLANKSAILSAPGHWLGAGDAIGGTLIVVASHEEAVR